VFVTTVRVAVLNAIDSILESKVMEEVIDGIATVELVDELRVPDEAPGTVELSECVDFSLWSDEEETELLDSIGRTLFVDQASMPEDNIVSTPGEETSEEAEGARRDRNEAPINLGFETLVLALSLG
jgi:hypothetical protein